MTNGTETLVTRVPMSLARLTESARSSREILWPVIMVVPLALDQVQRWASLGY